MAEQGYFKSTMALKLRNISIKFIQSCKNSLSLTLAEHIETEAQSQVKSHVLRHVMKK